MDDEEFKNQLAAANRCGLETRVGNVHAIAAHYDRAGQNLVLTLRGGLTLLVPVALLQGVAGSAPELIERVELRGEGSALHWEELDADFSVQDIAAGSFGTRSWMQKLEDAGLLDPASIERRRLVEELLDLSTSQQPRKGAAKTPLLRAKGRRPRKLAAA